MSSDDDDDDESNSPNELVRCPLPGARLNDSDLLPALKMLRIQFPQIGGLVDPLFLSSEPQEQNLNFREKNIYLMLINNNHWVSTDLSLFEMNSLFNLFFF